MTLAPYATHYQQSRGRFIEEGESTSGRSPFQRDRDRIIHSAAFRRLQNKTQVLTNSEEGDFRTRLTHTLEVAQLARSLARYLNVDEDLAELCALAHDLGHPPFGHAGEDTLNMSMKEYGGFNHNLQTLSIVRKLECRYGGFDGLNLTWESLEGIAKHNGPFESGFHDNPLCKDIQPESHASIEAQIAALCDDIAYNHHDLDDGISTGKINLDDVIQLPAVNRVWQEVTAAYPHQDRFRQTQELIRSSIDFYMKDVRATTKKNILDLAPTHVDDVRSAGRQLVMFSEEAAEEINALRAFLFENMYRHHEVNRQSFKAHKILTELFDAFMNHKRLLPPYAQACLEKTSTDKEKARVICDYLASLTDRSAVREYARLFGEIHWR